ncbi:MAG TPA: DotA/TraY family protein [Patescibacteria group bacterium]|nr:DotA/TraY family protein [Patescibacteria group bacterium]
MKAFFRSGFGDLAFLMASIYAGVRLLPPHHPYLIPANKGRFGMRNVIGEAYSRLVFKKENIDQIIVFFALVAGFALLTLQFAALIFSFVIRPAAATVVFPGMFKTANTKLDIALMLLDSVFGVPNLYQSCVDVTVWGAGACGPTSPFYTTFPTQYQIGLHKLFEYYDLAILLISVLVFLYYILVIVAETAQTGTPFGKRFDHIWAPIRLVVALGLLVPVNYGFNSAQYIALFAAKLGSGFATNGWLLFNSTLVAQMGGNSNLIGAANDISMPGITLYGPKSGSGGQRIAAASANDVLIARPKTPDVESVSEFMFLVWSCKVAYETLFPPGRDGNTNQWPRVDIQPYLVHDDINQLVTGIGAPSWQNALTFYNNKDIVIRFGMDGTGAGQGGTDIFQDQTGKVKPFCGEITVASKDVDPAITAGPTSVGIIEEGYYNWVLNMFFSYPEYEDFGIRASCIHLTPKPYGTSAPAGGGGAPYNTRTNLVNDHCTSTNFNGFGVADDNAETLPPQDWKIAQMQLEWNTINIFIDRGYESMLTSTNFTVSPQILNRGWGGAGIWYNQIAEWNGALFSIVETTPAPNLMPDVMEKVQESKKADRALTADETYEPNTSQPNGGSKKVDFDYGGKDEQIARELNDVYKYWEETKSTTPVDAKTTGNVFLDVMKSIFGLDALFDIRQNDNVNPLAQLVAIGKQMFDAALRNLLVTFAFSASGGFWGAIKGWTAASVSQAGSMWIQTFATIGLSIGFTLYYVLPFMPFLYFYFAVGGWVKAVFEAMVGVPLWAMAHLKIDGVGLPGGEQALNGYFLIFEIFVRPILIVFGMLASISIFSAVIRTLNGIWPMVTENVTGYDCANCATAGVATIINKHGIIDQFFYTCMYTVIVYLSATSCFKLIDQVPESIMRWMGAGVSSFADGASDPGGQLADYAAAGAGKVGGALGTMSSTLGGASGSLVANMVKGRAIGTGVKGTSSS